MSGEVTTNLVGAVGCSYGGTKEISETNDISQGKLIYSEPEEFKGIPTSALRQYGQLKNCLNNALMNSPYYNFKNQVVLYIKTIEQQYPKIDTIYQEYTNQRPPVPSQNTNRNLGYLG